MIRNDRAYCAFFRAALRLRTTESDGSPNITWKDFANCQRELVAVDMAAEILDEAFALADMAMVELDRTAKRRKAK